MNSMSSTGTVEVQTSQMPATSVKNRGQTKRFIVRDEHAAYALDLSQLDLGAGNPRNISLPGVYKHVGLAPRLTDQVSLTARCSI
jgi:hypothetical protein